MRGAVGVEWVRVGEGEWHVRLPRGLKEMVSLFDD